MVGVLVVILQMKLYRDVVLRLSCISLIFAFEYVCDLHVHGAKRPRGRGCREALCSCGNVFSGAFALDIACVCVSCFHGLVFVLLSFIVGSFLFA